MSTSTAGNDNQLYQSSSLSLSTKRHKSEELLQLKLPTEQLDVNLSPQVTAQANHDSKTTTTTPGFLRVCQPIEQSECRAPN